MKIVITSILIVCLFVLAGCKSQPAQSARHVEDHAAKQMLQGIWVNDDQQEVAFRAEGDTIYYPDDTSMPVYFQIFGDTLVMHGANEVKYHIIKQAPHVFIFENQTGDEVHLVKSEDRNDRYAFSSKQPVTLNQNKLIKRDTIVNMEGERYHCYVQVNPTTYKVIIPAYNDDGVEVGNVYHDNIIHLSVFKGAQRVFSRDFHKSDFSKQVPAQFLTYSVLSDFVLREVDSEGIHYNAVLANPNSQSTYLVDVSLNKQGQLKLQVLE